MYVIIMTYCMMFHLIRFYKNCFAFHSQACSRSMYISGLSVSITTTPPSPPFQAATWIRFACQSTGFLVTYNWTVYCVHNQPPNQPMIVAHFTDNTNLGEISLSLRSTAKSCADTVVCTTRDFSGNTGQATWTLGTVTGMNEIYSCC